jgi:hypothetical protein
VDRLEEALGVAEDEALELAQQAVQATRRAMHERREAAKGLVRRVAGVREAEERIEEAAARAAGGKYHGHG